MLLYTDITKLEPLPDGSIRVHGVASTGARDMAGEIVRPEAMKAALPAYLAFGAIREMHEPRAAGAALSAEVGPDGATRISAHIVDPTAVKKVKAGVYKGLSIGGKVLARDPMDDSIITAIRLDEISLVDRPCNPEAVIDLWKAQMLNEQTINETADDPPVLPPDLTDPFDTRYPLNTPEQIRAAWAAVAAGHNRAGRGEGELAALEARIITAWKTHIDPNGPPALQPPAQKRARTDNLKKITELEAALAAAQSDAETLQKRLDAQAAEITCLASAPLPPRAAGHHLAKAVGKEEDTGGGSTALTPDQIKQAMDAMTPAQRTHLLMKAALSRPMAI
jgi:hypothetical protein